MWRSVASRGEKAICVPRDERGGKMTAAVGALVPSLSAAQAAREPDAASVRCGGETLTYGALHERAAALAARLCALGVRAESPVAVVADRSIETVVNILGVLVAGGAYVPLDPEYPPELRAFMLADCGAQIVLERGAPHQRTAEAVRPAGADSHELARCEPDHLAYILYTSGSTGQPKGVLVTHGNLAHSTHARMAFYRCSPARFLLLSSFAFDSSIAGIFWTLCSGGTLVLTAAGEERDPAALAALIHAERITHTLCLPSLHALLLRAAGNLDTLVTVIVAGENCPADLPVEHARRLPRTELFNEYGPTEATVWSSVVRLSPEQPVSIGQPIPGAQIELRSEDGKVVPDGEPGEIHIAGPGLARGYHRLPELTAARFITSPSGVRWYQSGDLARRLPDGNIEFLGRLDRQVKIRGYRIELEAIEAVLADHPDVQTAVVLARDDAAGGQRLVAYVAPEDCGIHALRELLAEKLPAFMQPSVFVALDTLPRMPNGKVDRAALPAPSRARPALETSFAEPRSVLERHLADAWRASLHVDRVGLHDRFFDLGGDSLRAAKLCSRLQETLGEPVFVVAIFEAPTVAQLAHYLRTHYPAAIARVFGEATAVEPGRRIDAARLAGVRSLIVRAPRQVVAARTKNRRAIFILAPPRSGTTLLRAMLARHPGFVTASELRLLGFRTLGERRAAYAASEGVWRQGLHQVIAESKGCDLAEAAHLLETYERLDLGTGEFYALVQQWLGERVLVDKSPSYALDPACLQHAESLFADAFYIHLARHPYEMIRSFESRRMDRIYLPGAEDLSAREAGEAVWLIAHRNTRDFLATIPASRQHDLRFTDLVSRPRESMEALCAKLGVPFDPALLDPYENASSAAANDIHTADDPRFHEHGAIKPEVAEGWRGVLADNFLSQLTWELAEELGYEKPRELRPVHSVQPVQAVHPVPEDAIAIVGMAGRLPGARNVDEFWRNLCAGVESIRPFTPEELRASGLDPAIVAEPGYVNAGSQIDDADKFAASFFGYTPREAELMDPQQRVFLECAWEAFEHAGCDVSRFPGAIGVFAGLALNDYFQFNLATRPELEPMLGTYALTLGNEKDFVATRVAHKLRLRGPAIGVQTACSTSLVALHLACQSLRSGESDLALVGGGRISVPLHAGYPYVDGGIPSPDGHCRAFDAQARGCVPASGLASVVLKRLADAVRDGDRIYSVIRGTAINNDGGDKAGFTAPSVGGQAAVIARAHAAAGVSADTIGYVEAHGTGTSLGDPIEIAALTRAFRATTDATGFCRIGSVKTNIGHLDTGAGVAGLIKAALALDRGVIPPSLHFTAPNPQIDFARSPFVVNAALTAWPRTAAPRRAGVSSFGIGGTNAHAVLEEAPLVESAPPSRAWQLLVLSARTRRALEMATVNLAQHLRENPGLNLADVAHTLQSGRRAFEHRRFVVARDAAEAARHLRKRDRRWVFSTGVARGGAPLAATTAPPRRDGHEEIATLEALGHQWLNGGEIDWSRLHAGERRLRVPLPTYPFERERYWLGGWRAPSAMPNAGAIAPDSRAPSTALDQVRELLHGMSGVAAEKMTPSATLLELGFDSLFLTQVALALRKQFGVEVAFRQLFEELATIGALAAHVAQASSPVQSARPSRPQSPTTGGTPGSQSHGPFRPIQKDAADELTTPQREHLAALTARYTARTAESKRRTQQDRAHFADPRSVSGFRPYWKELTYPIVIERSAGSKLWDVDGHEYLDFTMGYGTNLLGHSPPFITEAIAAQLARGIEIGPQSPVAGEIARMLCEFSGLDRAAFTNTGSEAVLAAVRVARTVTGRSRIATFSGYHGINDEFLVRGKTIDGERRSMPIAPGIPEHIAQGVLALDYGTPESLALLRAHAHELAAVLVEPVQSRHPDLQPREFLHEVRRITQEAGAALVFDEVITGFRCHPGGAQAWFDVRADLVTYGKIIGGGMPMGALCGRRLYMDALDGGAWNFGDDSRPEAGVTFFAGTFVRHPLAMAASHATLKFLQDAGPTLQAGLNERTAQLVRELNAFLETKAAPIRMESFASMFLVKFADEFQFGAVLYFLLREKGIHAWDNRLFFLSTAHTEEDLAHFTRVFRECVEELAPWRERGAASTPSRRVPPNPPAPTTKPPRSNCAAPSTARD